jgi:hypothetical protein
MFILRRIYIISDGQYFALGIAGFFYKIDANVIRPQDIFHKKQFLEEGICMNRSSLSTEKNSTGLTQLQL